MLAITVTIEEELPDAAAAYVKAGTGKALAHESDRIDFKQPHPILRNFKARRSVSR